MDGDTTLKAKYNKAGSIRGTVINQNDEPLDGATVILNAVDADSDGTQGRKAVTDASGSYRFDGLPPGSYSLLYLKLGYQIAKPDTVQVNAKQTVSLDDVVLERVGGDVNTTLLPSMHSSQ